MALFFKEAFEAKEQEEEELENFRQEIIEIAIEENTALRERRKNARGHFQNIDTLDKNSLEALKGELDLRDMYIWKRIKNEDITAEEIRSYGVRFQNKASSKERDAIMSWMINRAAIIIGRRQLKKEE